ncbi:MAG TPA: ABC transporter permease [Verrucomicrobiae bacterium]|nr:ABC transporter permease [Verrucomicrobiae bacterium]
MLETVLQDIRYALRGIRRSPGFAAVIILTLALGIGANTAIFSVVYSVLLRPLPYPAGDRLVWMGESTGSATGISVTWINFQHWRTENRAFEEMAAFSGGDCTLTGRGEARVLRAALVTSSFLQLTGARPVLGRLLGVSDDQPGSPPTVLLTYDLWAHRLGADPSIVGQTLTLNGNGYQVVGVLRPAKTFLGAVDIYFPLGRSAGRATNRAQHGSMRVLGLLKPGVTLARARAGIDEIMTRLEVADPGPETGHRVYAEYLTEETIGDVRRTLLIMMGAVGLVLLLASANVASLLLVRNSERAREIAVRTAIGAGQSRLARQLLTENLVISVAGGAIGLGIAFACLRTLVAMAPGGIPRLSEATLDLPVLGFALLLTLAVGLLAGVAPSMGARRADLIAALKEGSAGSGGSRRGQALRNSLVVGEIAITLTLLFGAGLLLRSLFAAQTADPGFDSRRLLALELRLPPGRYRNADQRRDYYARLMAGLRAVPGVQTVSAVYSPPSAGDNGDNWYSVLDRPAPARADVPLSLMNTADAGYFRTMGIPLLAGREFDNSDRPGAELVTVINETIARRWWKTPQLAIGQRIKVGGPYNAGDVCRIVGVARDVKQEGLDRPADPEMYFAFGQNAGQMVVMIRTVPGAAPSMTSLRRAVAAVDSNVPVISLRPFEQWMAEPLARRRFTTLLLAIFASLAVVLASVGIYGVLNYWVNLRQREIAIRLAVGAQRSSILRWAGAHAARLVALGIVAGAIGSWAASGWLRSLVFGVSARNPAMLAAAGAGVIAIAALAASLPLWRATRVDAAKNLQ